MNTFDPVSEVENSNLILEQGKWPNFHDAEVTHLNMWRGDVRPDHNVWIGPVIEVSFILCALQSPFIAVLRFHDCESIRLQDFNQQNALYDLKFQYQSRGKLRDGSPMTPYILVEFEQAFGARLNFKCFKVEVVERKPLEQ